MGHIISDVIVLMVICAIWTVGKFLWRNRRVQHETEHSAAVAAVAAARAMREAAKPVYAPAPVEAPAAMIWTTTTEHAIPGIVDAISEAKRCPPPAPISRGRLF